METNATTCFIKVIKVANYFNRIKVFFLAGKLRPTRSLEGGDEAKSEEEGSIFPEKKPKMVNGEWSSLSESLALPH